MSLKFHRDVLRRVLTLDGVLSAKILNGGKHDRIEVVTSWGTVQAILSCSPSDGNAENAAVREIKQKVAGLKERWWGKPVELPAELEKVGADVPSWTSPVASLPPEPLPFLPLPPQPEPVVPETTTFQAYLAVYESDQRRPGALPRATLAVREETAAEVHQLMPSFYAHWSEDGKLIELSNKVSPKRPGSKRNSKASQFRRQTHGRTGFTHMTGFSAPEGTAPFARMLVEIASDGGTFFVSVPPLAERCQPYTAQLAQAHPEVMEAAAKHQEQLSATVVSLSDRAAAHLRDMARSTQLAKELEDLYERILKEQAELEAEGLQMWKDNAGTQHWFQKVA